MAYTYKYPRPMVTVDIVLFSMDGPAIALIKRKRTPFKGRWALPGGFVGIGEPLEESAKRELNEETGVKGIPLHQIGAFGDPERDPRGRVITVAYAGAAKEKRPALRPADDAAEARWFALDDLPRLAFDHREIIKKALALTRARGLL